MASHNNSILFIVGGDSGKTNQAYFDVWLVVLVVLIHAPTIREEYLATCVRLRREI